MEVDEAGWATAPGGRSFGLPEDESELEHLTEYNTAQNRIIDKTVLGMDIHVVYVQSESE